MKPVYKDYMLNEAVVDTVSADVQDYLNGLGSDSRSVQRIRLTVEELLLNILGHCGGLNISVGIGKHFGRHVFRLRYQTDPFDPTKSSDNPLADEMMRTLGLSPAWNCRGRSNTVSLILANRPKRSALFYILIAAAAAAALGALGGVIPESVRQTVSDFLLTPMSNAFLGLLNTFAGVMIFLTICGGILEMGDSATIGRMGKSVVSGILGISFAISAAVTVAVLPFLSLNYSSGGQEQVSAVDQISRMFFDILPTNIIDPFRTGNTFHLIVIAVFVGCAILAVGERGGRVRGLITESSAVFQQIVSSVSVLIPLFVFSMLLELIWSGEAGVLVTMLKPILIIAAMLIVITSVIWIVSSLRLKCPPVLLMKKALPASLVALTSASSVSAFPLGMETCEKKLGVKSSLTSFLYPLGAVIYMPASIVYFTAIVLSLAETYQIAVSIPWLIMAAVISTLITIAMPPIPGGDILCYTVLFSSLGIPADAIILATAMGIVFDYLDSGVNVMLLIFRLACDAKRLDCLDHEILVKE